VIVEPTLIDYAKMVDEYRSGDRELALSQALDWKPEKVWFAISIVERLQRGTLPAGTSARSKEAAQLVLASLPAAIMLHTEAGLYLNSQRGGVSFGGGWLWREAIRLAELDPATEDQRVFLRSWYRAFGLFFIGSYLGGDAIELLDRGHNRFPDDAPISLALGQAYEACGHTLDDIVTVRIGLLTETRHPLHEAEVIYRGLITQDASLGEARLRLGRVLAITGRVEPALEEFQQLVATERDLRLKYLAHLFAGDALRRESRLSDASTEFGRALEACPDGQAAALGLAETQHSLGRRLEATQALTNAIEDRDGRVRSDPFRTYSLGARDEQKRLLESVRDLARQ
jgi:tetratricopeptide (TPR) repeat protein